ncbi:uncharacterized protein METZ01_LOCUS342477, partial [marine metagenome]
TGSPEGPALAPGQLPPPFCVRRHWARTRAGRSAGRQPGVGSLACGL